MNNNTDKYKNSFLLVFCISELLFTPPWGGQRGAFGQDPQFSQFYANPMYINPALAGNTEQIRFISNYRKQWPSIPGSFTTYAFSTDYNILRKNSGVGLQLVRDKAGSGGLRFTNVGGFYSYRLNIVSNHFIRAGIKASYTIRDIDYSGLIFGDQVARNDGSSTISSIEIKKVAYPDFGAGFVYYGTQYWLGSALHHLNRPNQSLIGQKARLEVDYTVHGGGYFPLRKNSKGIATSSLTAAMLYKSQLEWDQMDIGAFYKREPFIAGLWYRGIPVLKAYKKGYSNHDALVFLAGIYLRDYRLNIGYTYDLTISRLAGNSGGSHEISIIYEYASPDYKKLKPKLVVPCPKFDTF